MLTIFTPTFNRARTLPRLYASLASQNCRDFEWVIVDDGSTDHTSSLVQQWMKEQQIRIVYHAQTNGGKYRATLQGLRLSHGDLFICVDSDDFLAENAVGMMLNHWTKYGREDLGGIIAHKADIQGRLLGADFPKGLRSCSTYQLAEQCHSRGERSLVYQTKLLKARQWTGYESETFFPECVVYDNIAATHQMLLFDCVLTICEYQDDGYTRNLFAIMLNNPCGYCHYYAQRIDMAQRWKERLGYMVRYLAFRHLSHHKGLRYQGRYGHLLPLLSPLGSLLVCYYKLKSQL